jgi:hypothetical protein
VTTVPGYAQARVHQTCSVQRQHRPRVILAATEEHHVQPRYLDGPDVPANKRWVCASCHNAAHLCLDALLRGRPFPEGSTRQQQALARAGFDAWKASGGRVSDHAGFVAHHPGLVPEQVEAAS